MNGYCRHGVFTGGSGIDWMCGECESGEPDPTPKEMQSGMRIAYTAKVRTYTPMIGVALSYQSLVLSELVIEELQKLSADVKRRKSGLAEARRWAENDDDTEWLYKKWEFETRDDLETIPFEALPAHALDGGY